MYGFFQYPLVLLLIAFVTRLNFATRTWFNSIHDSSSVIYILNDDECIGRFNPATVATVGLFKSHPHPLP